jgi:hypothetical protein
VQSRPREAGSFNSVPADGSPQRGIAAHLFFFAVFTALLFLTHPRPFSTSLTFGMRWASSFQRPRHSARAGLDRTLYASERASSGRTRLFSRRLALTGYSVVITRAAMLVLAAVGETGRFALAVHVLKPLRGVPAFTAAFLLWHRPCFTRSQ